MAFTPTLKTAYWSLAIAGGCYFAFLSLLLNEKIQRHALYAHKVQAWWQNLDEPEQWGFLKNQIQAFNVPTTDGEVLYAWHILPVALYTKNEEALLREPGKLATDVTMTQAFKLLAEDSESRLVISFHGNAGAVQQGWRTDTYRALASGAADKIHVVTIDYRGFGRSTGNPTEAGLILDGIALVRWALEVARIPPSRIILIGQSLGTAVTAAVAEHYAIESRTEFAGVVLVATFTDIPSLMLTYSIGGVIPILSPLRPYPFLQKFFSQHISDTWRTESRVSRLIRQSRNVNLVLVHARNDFDISWKHTETMFHTAANATSEEGLTIQQIDAVKLHTDLGRAGWRDVWTTRDSKGGKKNIRQEIVRDGGHNRVMTYGVVAKSVYDLFFGVSLG